MPRELWANNAATTLTVAVATTPAAGTVETWTVASTAAFPVTAGQVRCICGSEYVNVATPVLSATTISVTRGTEGSPTAAHPITTSVVPIVTAGALDSMVVDRIKNGRATALAATYAGRSLLPPGVRLRGANLTIKTDVALNTPQGWATWYADATWLAHATLQVDRAISLGLNAVRLPGDIYGIKAGTFTQAAYNAKWVQFLDYCTSKKMMVVATGILSTHANSATQAEINAFLTSWGAVIEQYPCVVLCDIYGEADYETGVTVNGAGWAAHITKIQSMAAAFRTVSTIPLTVSGLLTGSGAGTDATTMAAWVNGLKSTLDYFDFHQYNNAQFADLNTVFLNTQKPFLIGEFGASMNSTSGQRQTLYAVMNERIASRPECMGAMAWALDRQGASLPDDYSLFDAAGVERTEMTNELRLFSTSTESPWIVTVDLLPNSGLNFVPATATAWNIMSVDQTIVLGRACNVKEIMTIDGGFVTEAYGRLLRDAAYGEANTAHRAGGRAQTTGITHLKKPLLAGTHSWRMEIQPGSDAAGCTIYGLQAGQSEPNTVAYVELTGR